MKVNLKIKYLSRLFVLIFGVVIVFTFIDFIFHSLKESFAVPGYYYRNKIIFGTLIGFATYFFVRKMKPLNRAFVFSAVVAILLQVRYFLEGYQLWFVFLFLGLHFLMVLPVSFVAFRISDKKKWLK